MTNILDSSNLGGSDGESPLLVQFNRSRVPLDGDAFDITEGSSKEGSRLTRGDAETKLQLMWMPPAETYIQVHPDPQFHLERALVKDSGKFRLVHREIYFSLEDCHRHKYLILLCVTLKKKPFAWYIEILKDKQYETSIASAGRCMTQWCQVFRQGREVGTFRATKQAALGLACHKVCTPVEFASELFGENPLVSLEDPFLKRLRGEEV
jgi:hypothetical protein